MSFIVVVVAGFAAGLVNVLAGGGSFLTLPALIFAGLTALGANVSSTVALFPAQLLAAFLVRKSFDLKFQSEGVGFRALALVSLVGGLFGALLLLVTPPDVFLDIVPWLLLFATGVFASGRQTFLRGDRRLSRNVSLAIQAAVAIYGGYFGGGIGILMLAALTIYGFTDMKLMTNVKIVLAMLMNIAAVLTFLVAGLVQWPATVALGVASIGGTLLGIRVVDRVPPLYVRRFVIVTGVVLTIAFFWQSAHHA